jgi:hypothetical protein
VGGTAAPDRRSGVRFECDGARQSLGVTAAGEHRVRTDPSALGVFSLARNTGSD